MQINQINVSDHVRYAISLTRTATEGGRYVAMKTSIEVRESLDETKVRDAVSRALKRELHHDESLESLFKYWPSACLGLVSKLRSGDSGLIFNQGLLIYPGEFQAKRHFHQDCFEISIFTKQDEAKADKLFAKL